MKVTRLKVTRLKVTRRSVARMLAVTATLPVAGSAQEPASKDNALNAARENFREAARVLGAMKIPRSLEPAARFEA